MDFANLSIEHETLSNHIKQGLSTINDLNGFFKSTVKYGELLYQNTRTTSEKVFSELIKSDNKSNMSKQIFCLYRNFESYNAKYKIVLKRVESDIVEPTTVFEKHLADSFKLCLEKLKGLNSGANARRLVVEKAKMKYFDSCRLVQEKEKIIMKQQENLAKLEGNVDTTSDNNTNNNNNTNSNNNVFTELDTGTSLSSVSSNSNIYLINNLKNKLNTMYENLIELKVTTENLCHAYKKEVEKANEDYLKYEEKYFEVLSDLKRHEESRLYYLKCHLEKYMHIQKEVASFNKEYSDRLIDALNEIEITGDLESFSSKFPLSFCSSNNKINHNNNTNNSTKDSSNSNNESLNEVKITRLPREEFLNYEIYKRNIESLIKSNNNNINESSTNTNNTSFGSGLRSGLSSFLPGTATISSSLSSISSGIMGVVNSNSSTNNNNTFSKDSNNTTNNNNFSSLLDQPIPEISFEMEMTNLTKELVSLLYEKAELSKELKKRVFSIIKKKDIDKRFKQISSNQFDITNNNNDIVYLGIPGHKNSSNTNSISKSDPLTSIVFCKKIIDEILHSAKKPNTLDFLNKENFIFLGDVLVEALNLIKTNEEDYFELYFAVLFISCKSRFYEKKVKSAYYLSAYIGVKASKITKNPEFWRKLIMFKILRKNASSEKSVYDKFKDFVDSLPKKDEVSAKNNSKQVSTPTSMLFSIGSKFKNMLYNTAYGNSSNSGVNSNAIKRVELDEYHSKLLRNALNMNLMSVLKEFIPHLAYFGYSNEQAMGLISAIYYENNTNNVVNVVNNNSNSDIEKEKIKYLEALVVANQSSIKCKSISCCLNSSNNLKCTCDLELKYLDFIEDTSKKNKSRKNSQELIALNTTSSSSEEELILTTDVNDNNESKSNNNKLLLKFLPEYKIKSFYNSTKNTNKELLKQCKLTENKFPINQVAVLLSLSFLPEKDRLSVLLLNKRISKHALKIVADLELNYKYSSLSIPINKRISVWEALLKVKNLRNTYNYTDIINQVKDIVPYIPRKCSEPEVNNTNNDNDSKKGKNTINTIIEEKVDTTNTNNDDNSSNSTNLNVEKVDSGDITISFAQSTSDDNSLKLNTEEIRIRNTGTVNSNDTNNNNNKNEKHTDNVPVNISDSSYDNTNINNKVILNSNINSSNNPQTEKLLSNKTLVKNFEVLLLDVHRTFFRHSVQQKRASIANILKAILLVNPTISYCQGMSYIAAYILEISNSEEDAFFLLLGIFTNTNYCEIFYYDLFKLKRYFQVYEKALSLIIPECQGYLNSSFITASHYASSWFITLFTICLQHIVDTDNPRFLLTIWDNFILYGWKAVITAAIVIVKNYSEDILMLKFEDLLHFLLNDILRTGFIQNVNNEKFLITYYSVELSDDTYSALEMICDIEEKNSKPTNNNSSYH